MRYKLTALDLDLSSSTPERALCYAMFERAILDYFFNTASIKNYKEHDRDTAESWLLDDYPGSASTWAEMFELEGFLSRVRQIIRETKEGQHDLTYRNTIKHELQRPVRYRVCHPSPA